MLKKTQISEAEVPQSGAGIRRTLLAMIEEFAKVEPNSLAGTEHLDALEHWDSLASLDFVLEVEKRFGLQINSEDLENCKTVDDLVNAVFSAQSQGMG
jgi:acyl carrier protein